MLNSEEKKFALCATKKINILIPVLSEKKILNQTKNHNPLPACKSNGRSLNLSPFCNISQNVYTTFIVNSVMSRLFDTHVNDWHNCLSLERSVSGRGGNKPRTY